MLRINELRLHINHTQKDLSDKISKLLGSKYPYTYEIHKRSLDARKKPNIFYCYTIDIYSEYEDAILKHGLKNLNKAQKKTYRFPIEATDVSNEAQRPVVVGFGPAGMFCALYLARAGFRPIVYERGYDVDKRTIAVKEFWNKGFIDPNGNVQFGEGGAGAFSDGKLNTQTKDRYGINSAILSDFVKYGADRDILIDKKPHIGTDVLTGIIKNIRKEIIALGGDVRFESCVDGFEISDNAVSAIKVNGERIKADTVILAPGHSARDTFAMLCDIGMKLEPKSFAVGVRVSHPCHIINNYVYGSDYNALIGNASYKVTHICNDKRGVYSFCMCPGGYVVNASNQNGMIAVNGMSYSGRNSQRSNSAIIVTITPDDYMSGGDVLSGVRFQQELEKKAFEAGNGAIPAQEYPDFKNNKLTDESVLIDECIKGSVKSAMVSSILPDYIYKDIVEGIEAFDRTIPGFASPEAIVYGVESRTSSPIRMTRDENGISSIDNLYVCGEGAGYAGGIMSAAADGIRIAESVARSIVYG